MDTPSRKSMNFRDLYDLFIPFTLGVSPFPSMKKNGLAFGISGLPSDVCFEMRHFSQEDGINVFLGNHEGKFWGDLLELMASLPIVSMGLVYLPTSMVDFYG